MPSALAAVGLTFVNGCGLAGDLQPANLSWFLEITEGLDSSMPVRGEDQVMPFRHGRVSTQRFGDSRPLVCEGWVQESQTTALVAYRSGFDFLLRLFDPTAGVGRLVAVLEDGTTRFISCYPPTGLIAGTQDIRGFRKVGVQLVAPDPFWYANLGVSNWDPVGPRYWGQDYTWEDSADLVITPTSFQHVVTLDSQSPLQVDRVRVVFDGGQVFDPSAPLNVAYPGIELIPADGSAVVGFRLTAGTPPIYVPGGGVIVGDDVAMQSGESWFFDNAARQSASWFNGTKAGPRFYVSGPELTAYMVRSAGNKDGEFFHLPPAGPAQLVIYGWPTRCRIQWFPTYP